MEFEDVIKSYEKLDLNNKRNEIINNLIIQIKFLKKVCDEKGIKYRNIKADFINDDYLTEDETLRRIFIYVNILNELNSRLICNLEE